MSSEREQGSEGYQFPGRQGETYRVEAGPGKERVDREYAPDPSQYERGHFEQQRYGGALEGGGYAQGEVKESFEHQSFQTPSTQEGTGFPGDQQYEGDAMGQGGGQYYAPASEEYGRPQQQSYEAGGQVQRGQISERVGFEGSGAEQFPGDDVGTGQGQYHAPSAEQYGRI